MVGRRTGAGFKLRNRRWYPWLFVLLCAAGLAIALVIDGGQLRVELVVSTIGGAGGLTAFLYTQHLQETRLFTELFQAFNKRYDELNQRLNTLANSGVLEFNAGDQQVLMDYFNLCGEEYLYYSAGYVDDEVWRSWANGMRFFADVPAIRTLWTQELEGGSYYGFTLELLAVA